MAPCATPWSTGPRWCTGGTSSRSSTGTSTPKRCSACCPPASRWRRWRAVRGWGSSRSSCASGSLGCRRSPGCPGSPRRTCAPTSAARTGARHLVLLPRRGAPRRGGHGAGDLPPAVLLVGDVDRAVSDDDLVSVSSALARASGGAQRCPHRDRRSLPPRGADRAGPLPHRPLGAVQRAALWPPPRPRRARALAAPSSPGGRPARRARRRRGTPPTHDEPLVHYSPTVAVRIGWPSRIDRV